MEKENGLKEAFDKKKPQCRKDSGEEGDIY